jgi:hypothetical protein
MIKNLREWLDKPVPDSKEGIQPWLDEIWEYMQKIGDLKGIAELAEADVIDGDEPHSSNSIYLTAYKAATAYHSIDVEVNDV